MLRIAVHDPAGGVRTRERHDLRGYDPVQVAVLDALVVLVLVRVEGGEVEQAVVRGLGDGVQDVEQTEAVRAGPG